MQVIGLVLLTTDKKDTMRLICNHVSERVKMAPAVTTAIYRTGLTSFRTEVVHIIFGDRGGTMVKVLCYKSEGPGLIPDGVIGNFH